MKQSKSEGSRKLKIHLDFRSGLPITMQIVEQVQNQALNGQLQPGAQLPTVRALADELDINHTTVARAYRLLDQAGLISTQHGRGTFILEKPYPAQERRLKEETLSSLTRRYVTGAARLGFTPDDVESALGHDLERWRAGSLVQTDDDPREDETD